MAPPMAMIIIDAEKCGSSTRSPTIRKSSARKGSIPYLKLAILPRKRHIMEEKDRITASFASSEGCKVRPPMPSQRLAPLVTDEKRSDPER